MYWRDVLARFFYWSRLGRAPYTIRILTQVLDY